MTSEPKKLSREDAMRLMWPTDADPRDYPSTYEGTEKYEDGEMSEEQRKAAGRAEDFREQVKKAR